MSIFQKSFIAEYRRNKFNPPLMEPVVIVEELKAPSPIKTIEKIDGTKPKQPKEKELKPVKTIKRTPNQAPIKKDIDVDILNKKISTIKIRDVKLNEDNES